MLSVKAGDYLQLGERLHVVTGDALADGAGAATLGVWPAVRDVHRHRRRRLCPVGRLAQGKAMIGGLVGWLAGSRWALAAAKWGAVGLTVLLFLLSVRRAGERAGRMAQRLDTMEKANDVQRRMLEAAARRPRNRDELARRLRDSRF